MTYSNEVTLVELIIMSEQRRQDLENWYKTPRGQLFAGELHNTITPWVQDIFGYHAVQLGDLPPENWLLKSSRINHLLLTDQNEKGQFSCLPEALPLDTDSVDLVIVAHTLEYCHDPHAVLREAERVLVPNGHLLVVGIHPLNLWGAWRKLRGLADQVYSQGRVADWLGLLSFDLKETEMLPMVDLQLPGKIAKGPRAQKILKSLSASAAGGYALLAQKRVTNLKPLKPSWRRRPKLIAGGLAEPAAQRIKRTRHD